MEKNRIVICVAPVGNRMPPGIRNPVAVEELVDEVVQAERAGASMVHLHVRDQQGKPTDAPHDFVRTLELIRERSKVIIQASTGGEAGLEIEDRSVSLDDARVEVASLNMGSVNFGEGVYLNSLPDIRRLAQKMRKKKLVAELEVFDASMVETAKNMIQHGLMPSSCYYNFNLGFPGALSAEPRNLCMLRSLISEDDKWGIVVNDRRDFLLVAAGIGLGATIIRVGFEDSPFLNRGRVAASNADLVRAAAELTRNAGLEPASPDEARGILGTRRGAKRHAC